jgi:hypothetical protein
VIARTNIVRSDENTIQVYREIGNAWNLSISFNAQAVATIFTIDASGMKGGVNTKFYSVPLSIDPNNKATSLEQLQSLTHVIGEGSLEGLNELQKPFILHSKLSQKAADLGILWWQWRWSSQRDLVAIQAPTGQKRVYERRVRGNRSGKDYEDFAFSVATGLLKQGGSDIAINRPGTTDPGITIAGESKAHLVDYQAQIGNYDGSHQTGQTQNEVLKIQYRWEGWRANNPNDTNTAKKKGSTPLMNIINEVNQHAGQALIPADALKDTTAIDLYNITLNYMIYDGAVPALGKNSQLLRQLLSAKGVNDQKISSIISDLARLSLMDKAGNFDAYANLMIDTFNFLETHLPLTDIINAAGGDNVFVYAQVGGFREGDELGDQAYMSNSIGRVGSRFVYGPLSDLVKRIGISENELMATWMMEAL